MAQKRSNDYKPQLTPKQKSKAVAAYLDCGTLLGAARATGFSVGTIKKCVNQCRDFEKLYNKRRELEASELFAALSAKSKQFAQFSDMFFDYLCKPDVIKRLAYTDLEKLTRVFGITMDKFFKLREWWQKEHVGDGDNEILITIERKNKGDEPIELSDGDDDEYYDDEEDDDD